MVRKAKVAPSICLCGKFFRSLQKLRDHTGDREYCLAYEWRVLRNEGRD